MARVAPSVELSDGQLVASSVPVEFTRSSADKKEPNATASSRVQALRVRVSALNKVSRVQALRVRVEALHARHNQKSHGNWTRSVKKGPDFDEAESEVIQNALGEYGNAVGSGDVEVDDDDETLELIDSILQTSGPSGLTGDERAVLDDAFEYKYGDGDYTDEQEMHTVRALRERLGR
jgi:hypothetical protein